MVEASAPVGNEGLPADVALNARRREVLDAALALLVAGSDGLTMTGVARKASCSKETLYKWFGDRDGLLVETVQWQAAKVRAVPFDKDGLDATFLRGALEKFASDLLGTLAGTVSVALNRLAVSHAAQEKSELGRIVLENGRFSMGRRLKPLLEAARDNGLLAFEDSESAFRTYFGLVVRDTQIRMLLGEALVLEPETIRDEAERATAQFMVLHRAD